MASKSEKFKYTKQNLVGEAFTIIALFAFLVIVLQSDISNTAQLFWSLSYIFVLLFLLKNTNFHIQNYEIDSDKLTINKRIFSSTIIHLNKIEKITIRKAYDNTGGSIEIMAIFYNKTNEGFVVSDLIDSYRFILVLKKKGKEFDFKVVHQDESRKVINDMMKTEFKN